MIRIGQALFTLLLIFGALAASPRPAGCAENRTAILRVEGMTCAACTFAVKAALQKVEGVQAAEVSFREKKAVVTYDPARTSQEILIEAVESTGFRATSVSEGGKTR
ncbi:metal-binding (seleno)protein [Deferrisoma palaeochoriense]